MGNIFRNCLRIKRNICKENLEQICNALEKDCDAFLKSKSSCTSESLKDLITKINTSAQKKSYSELLALIKNFDDKREPFHIIKLSFGKDDIELFKNIQTALFENLFDNPN